jgi:hypothetical protein
MNTETTPQVDPSATTQIPADAQLSTLQTEEHHDDADPAKKDGDAAAAADSDKTIRKLQRRIDSRTRGLGERDAEIARLNRELETARRSPRTDTGAEDDGAPAPKQLSEADVDRRARELADQRVYAESISTKTQSMLKAGKDFDGFQELAAEVAQEIPFLDRSGKPTPFIEDVLDRDPKVAAELLAHLGRNPDVLADLAEMSERQRVRKLALIEIEIAKKPEPRSKAAKPLNPVGGRSDTSRDPSAMTDAEWAEQRRKKRASG